LYRNERLVYCGGLRPIHDNNLNRFAESRKPCRQRPSPAVRATKSPALRCEGRGFIGKIS